MTTLTRRSEAGPWTGRALAALAGLAAAAFALGIGDLVAGLFRDVQAPRDAVGEEFIDRTPAGLKDFAIEQFGTNDKVALRIGMLIAIGLLGLLLGALSWRRPWIGVVGIAAFGVVGAVVAVQRPTGRALDALPPIVGSIAGIAALLMLLARLRVRSTMSGVADAPVDTRRESWVDRVRQRLGTTERKATIDRRGFFVAGGSVAVAAVAAGSIGTWLRKRFDVSSSRADVVLPTASSPAGAVPAGAQSSVDGVSEFTTSNGDFYRIDTALSVPQVPAESWKLAIHGMVDNELELDFDQLLRRRVVERDITLTCVSNEVGGKLVGNARWLGVPLADILDEAGVEPGADQLKSTSADGWTSGTPVAAIMDGRDALLAFGMNGEPLPVEHGFPVRMVVPGLYGFVSATKWLVDLELTTFEDFDPYWARRGWAQQAPIKTQSRIDAPKPLARVSAGPVGVGGVAWAQHRGIRAVEVRVDEGAWQQAELADERTIDTWRQWMWTWDATPGNHKLEVRATDATGDVQPEERVAPIPDGATGWHSVVVRVS